MDTVLPYPETFVKPRAQWAPSPTTLGSHILKIRKPGNLVKICEWGGQRAASVEFWGTGWAVGDHWPCFAWDRRWRRDALWVGAWKRHGIGHAKAAVWTVAPGRFPQNIPSTSPVHPLYI